MIEGSFNYKFNIGDLVKLKYKYPDRIFKVTNRKNRRAINLYDIETIDDFLDEDNFELSKWRHAECEYQSKIRNLTPEEQLEYKKKQESEKFNL